MYLSVKEFKHMLEGRQFVIYINHWPLRFAFKKIALPGHLRHLKYVSLFSTDNRHISGEENTVTDSLSRIQSINTIDYGKISDEQINNKELKK